MIRAALLMARKDLILLCARGAGLTQALLLGLLLLFIFSLARGVAEEFSAQAASAVFWMATLFCQVLIFNALYALEEDNGQRQALLMLPVPAQSLWMGKGLAGMLILLTAQGIFIPATVVFLDQDIQGGLLGGLRLILMADLGLAAAGSLLGALAQGQAARESLLSVIIFPLLLPLLLPAIRLGAETISGAGLEEAENWFRLLLVFDGLFLAAGLALFGFIYNAQE